MTVIEIDYFEPQFGAYAGKVQLKVHDENACIGPFCTVHNPSDHPLRDAPLQWRADRGLMERRCGHGVGHPDPDDLAFKRLIMTESDFAARGFELHGCDGCCEVPDAPKIREIAERDRRFTRREEGASLPRNVDLPTEWFDPPEDLRIKPEQQFRIENAFPLDREFSSWEDFKKEIGEIVEQEAINDARARIQDNQILKEVWLERRAQDDVWGEQNWIDGTGISWVEHLVPFFWREDRANQIVSLARAQYQRELDSGKSTWRGIALEEIAEAFAETDPEKLRAELVQCAAVFVNWIGAIDRRTNETDNEVSGA